MNFVVIKVQNIQQTPMPLESQNDSLDVLDSSKLISRKILVAEKNLEYLHCVAVKKYIIFIPMFITQIVTLHALTFITLVLCLFTLRIRWIDAPLVTLDVVFTSFDLPKTK